MNEVKIIPDATMFIIGVSGLIVYASIYLISSFADHALLAFSVMCTLLGIFIIGMLKKYSEPGDLNATMGRDDNE